jgi:hypothetical protein
MNISENEASNIANKGTLIGESSPSRETKGSFWQVYLYEGELYAIGIGDVNDCWVFGGEKITREQIDQYVDDTVDAIFKLDQLTA